MNEKLKIIAYIFKLKVVLFKMKDDILDFIIVSVLALGEKLASYSKRAVCPFQYLQDSVDLIFLKVADCRRSRHVYAV